MLDEAGGVGRTAAIEALETHLAEPLPDEVSERELELIRRRREAKENEAALVQLMGLAAMQEGND